MTTREIANKVADYCKKGDFITAQKELYADDAISIEPEAMNGFEKETTGLKSINQKIQKFLDNVEKSYSNTVSDILVAGNSFAFAYDMDIKLKGQDRMTMSEICTYTVKDGKIIREEFTW